MKKGETNGERWRLLIELGSVDELAISQPADKTGHRDQRLPVSLLQLEGRDRPVQDGPYHWTDYHLGVLVSKLGSI